MQLRCHITWLISVFTFQASAHVMFRFEQVWGISLSTIISFPYLGRDLSLPVAFLRYFIFSFKKYSWEIKCFALFHHHLQFMSIHVDEVSGNEEPWRGLQVKSCFSFQCITSSHNKSEDAPKWFLRVQNSVCFLLSAKAINFCKLRNPEVVSLIFFNL